MKKKEEEEERRRKEKLVKVNFGVFSWLNNLSGKKYIFGVLIIDNILKYTFSHLNYLTKRTHQN